MAVQHVVSATADLGTQGAGKGQLLPERHRRIDNICTQFAGQRIALPSLTDRTIECPVQGQAALPGVGQHLEQPHLDRADIEIVDDVKDAGRHQQANSPYMPLAITMISPSMAID